MKNVRGRDMIALAESRGIYKNPEGIWETLPDIEHALLSRFLEEDHRKLQNDPQWIGELKERLERLEDQF